MNLAAKLLGIGSAIIGAIGSFLLYKGTFGFEAPAVYADEKFVAEMRKRNQRRHLLQRIGFACLMLSFALAGIGIAISP